MDNQLANLMGREWFSLGETSAPQFDPDFMRCLHDRTEGNAVDLIISWKTGYNDAQQEAFDEAEMMHEMRDEWSGEQYFKDV